MIKEGDGPDPREHRDPAVRAAARAVDRAIAGAALAARQHAQMIDERQQDLAFLLRAADGNP